MSLWSMHLVCCYLLFSYFFKASAYRRTSGVTEGWPVLEFLSPKDKKMGTYSWRRRWKSPMALPQHSACSDREQIQQGWHPLMLPNSPQRPHSPTIPALGASLSKKPLETNTCSSQASQEVVKRELQSQPHPYVAFIASQYSQFFFPPEIFSPALPITNKQPSFSC